MRIISQDGNYDYPYDGIEVQLDGVFINLRRMSNCNELVTVAVYSTKEKARMAIKMLHDAYSGILHLTCMDELKPDVKPPEAFLTCSMSGDPCFEHMENYYFKFPDDKDVKV